MPTSIHHIIKGCNRNDRKCQRQLFDMHNGMLYSVAVKYMNNAEDAKEVLQDAWINIFNGLSNYKEEGNFAGWAKTIVIRQAWKAIRTKANTEELIIGTTEVLTHLDEQWFDKMTCEEILNLLEMLPVKSKVVFKMYVIDEYTHAEISELLGINTSTSRAHLSNARKMLKEKFEFLNKVSSNGTRAI